MCDAIHAFPPNTRCEGGAQVCRWFEGKPGIQHGNDAYGTPKTMALILVATMRHR